jgi:bifunctional isochorismate lyase/aryl carrier protein
MKEDYFGGGKHLTQSEDFLNSVFQLIGRSRREWSPDFSTAALLVLDMQDYFLVEKSHAYIPSASAIIPGITALQRAFLEKGLHVFQTRHINNVGNAGSMAFWWRELITEDSHFSLITPQLTHPDIPILAKTQYDAFFKTSLEEDLRKRNVTRLIITGVMAHLCCETTARSAFMRGFEVFFVVDAVATYNRRFHEASILNLTHGFAIPVLTGEILGGFS